MNEYGAVSEKYFYVKMFPLFMVTIDVEFVFTDSIEMVAFKKC